LRLYRIEVAVDWHDGHRERRLSLATLRLSALPLATLPLAPAPP
jgi:hypothetical protein